MYCMLSNQPCERVCIHPECSIPAFICNTPDGCQNSHKHPPNFQSNLVNWSILEQLNHDMFNKFDEIINKTINDVTEKVEIIISEMRQTLSRYTERLNQIRASLRLRPEVADIRNKINNGEYHKLTGRDISSFYIMLRQHNVFENRQNIQVAIAHLNDRGFRLLQGVRKKINEFLQKDPEDRADEKQQPASQDRVERLTSKIKKDSNNPERYFQRGLQYSKLGKIRDAEDDYTKALQLNPNYIDARLNRGIIYYNSNRFQEAEQDYNLAIQLDPNNSKAYNNRGRLYHDCRKLTQAEDDYKKAITLAPNFVKCYLNRAMLFNESHRLKEAEEDYTKVISLEDNNSKAFSNRGLLRFHQERYDEAEADYNRAIELEPTNDGTLNNRGYLFFKLGQFPRALADYNRAISLRQKPLYLKNRSDAYAKMGKIAQAEDDIRKAKELKSKSFIM